MCGKLNTLNFLRRHSTLSKVALVKKLLGGAVVSTILGIIFAGLLIKAHYCLTKAVNADDPKQQATCYVAKLAYFILLGICIAISVSLSITSWVASCREKTRNRIIQSDGVLHYYYNLSSPEEEDSDV